jgi:Ribbon-helix-helix protein, copG family
MKNVTITLDENLASQVRVKAAMEGKSVSGFISDLLEREVGRSRSSPLEAIEAFLCGPRWSLSDEDCRLPRREEIYGERADELLRRYEHSRSRD